MKSAVLNRCGAVASAFLVAGVLASCNKGNRADERLETSTLKVEIDQIKADQAAVEKNLATFDTLDFDIFSHQKWDRLGESHADNIVVHWPDGHSTTGIQVHIEDLKAMFVYAPDTKITTHPVRFGSGNWTCATGVMTGTFSQPMPIGNGQSIPPTGKTFNVPMCTVGRWENGKMVEESLFWDNQTFMKQIGLAK